MVVGFQIPACVLAILIGHPTPERLWVMVTVSYVASAIVYVLVFRFARWEDAASRAATPSAREPAGPR